MLFDEVRQPQLGLIAASDLDDAEHRASVRLREVIDDRIDAVTDDTDTLCAQRLSASAAPLVGAKQRNAIQYITIQRNTRHYKQYTALSRNA